MAFNLSWIGVDSLGSNLKTANAEELNYESGIETASNASSSTSSLGGQASKPTEPFVNKPVVTGATYIRPQVSCAISGGSSNRMNSLDLVVIFRGYVKLLKPIPYDRNARTRVMKMYAKRLQNETQARYCKMRISENNIKLYTLDESPTLLHEIRVEQLDLIKQSKKDITFFYFLTHQPENNPVKSPVGESELSDYVCYVFHGTSPRVTNQAHRLIKQHVEANSCPQPKPGYFNLIHDQANAAAGLPSTTQPAFEVTSLVGQTPIREFKSTVSLNSEKPQPVVEQPTRPSCAPELDLLFSMDELSNPTRANSTVSMFDNLTPSAPDNMSCNATNLDLLGDLLSQPTPAPKAASFTQQHLNYSIQMGATVGVQMHPKPMSPLQPSASNPFMAPLNSTNVVPSLMGDLKPTPALFPTQFAASQPMAPPVPLRAAPNPFASMLPSNPASSYSNPFGAPVSKASLPPMTPMMPSLAPVTPMAPHSVTGNPVQYPSGASNPFAAASHGNAKHMAFGSDFDSFLSQTVKGHFKSGDK